MTSNVHDPRDRWSLHAIWGGIVILVVAGFYALALPRLGADGSDDGGGRLGLAGGVDIELEPGWKINSTGGALASLTKDGATLAFVASMSPGDIDATIRQGIENLEFDPNEHWEVGKPIEATSYAGARIVTYQAHSPTFGQKIWIIVGDGATAVVTGVAPSSVWPFISTEMDAMVYSAMIGGGVE